MLKVKNPRVAEMKHVGLITSSAAAADWTFSQLRYGRDAS